MKSRLRAGISFLAFLLFIGIASTDGSRTLDGAMAIFVLGVYVFGSAVLVLKALASKPGERRRTFSGQPLALMPKSWRQWMLDEKERPARQ